MSDDDSDSDDGSVFDEVNDFLQFERARLPIMLTQLSMATMPTERRTITMKVTAVTSTRASLNFIVKVVV